MKPQALALLAALLFACAPPSGEGGDCQGPADCELPQTSTCAPLCPDPAAQLCIGGSCQALPEDRVQVQADVMLHFSLTGRVASIIYVFMDPRSSEPGAAELGCADLQDGAGSILDPAFNVIQSGFVNFQATAGTAFFPDANLGSVPTGRPLLIVQGHAAPRGEGDLVARACLADLLLSLPGPVTTSIQLDPIAL